MRQSTHWAERQRRGALDRANRRHPALDVFKRTRCIASLKANLMALIWIGTLSSPSPFTRPSWALICLCSLVCRRVGSGWGAFLVGLLAWWTWLHIPSCMSYNYASASQVWLPGAACSHPCPIPAWRPLAVSLFAASRLYTNELTPVVG